MPSTKARKNGLSAKGTGEDRVRNGGSQVPDAKLSASAKVHLESALGGRASAENAGARKETAPNRIVVTDRIFEGTSRVSVVNPPRHYPKSTFRCFRMSEE
jgi:hypothetical protein